MNHDVSPPAYRRPDRDTVLALVVLLAAALLAVFAYRVHAGAGYPLDDSWIHLAYAKNFITGNGFAATAGEPTPGATSPLWVTLLAPGFLFGEVHDTWPWLLGALLLGLCAFRAWMVTRWLIGREAMLLPLACGLCVALNGPLVWSAAGAMEVPLFAALILLTILVFGSPGSGVRKGLGWGVLTGLTALARPEGLLLLGLLPAIALLGRRREKIFAEAGVGILSAIAVYSVSIVFSLVTAGRIFPNTFYAKTTQLFAGAPDASFLGGVSHFWFTESPVSAIGAVAGVVVVVLALRAGETRRVPLALLGITLGLPLAYAMMGRTYLFAGLAGNFGRYLYPVFPTALILGFWLLGRGLALVQSARVARGVAAVVVVAAIALTFVGTQRRADLYRHNVDDINQLQVAMAHDLARQLPAGSLVAANDVGALAYFTEFRVLDLIGIISTQTLDRLESAGPDPRARLEALYGLLQEERPDALVVFPHWYGPILEAIGGQATEISRREKRDNITAASGRLVAFRVRWR